MRKFIIIVCLLFTTSIYAELEVGDYGGKIFYEPFISSANVGARGGTLVASPTVANGITLNGSSQYVAYSGSFLTGQTSLTIEIWFTPDFDYDDDYISHFCDGTSTERYFINKQDNANSYTLNIVLGNTTIAAIAEGTYSSYWSVNALNHLVVSSNGTLTNAWLNNNQILTNDATAWTPTTTATFWIGTYYGADTGFFDGIINAFNVYNTVWTATEVAAAYNRGVLRPVGRGSADLGQDTLYKDLIYWCPLTNKWMQSTTVVSDRTPYGNTGTLENSPTVGSSYTEFDHNSSQSVEWTSTITLSSEYSLSAWINADTFNVTSPILGVDEAAQNIWGIDGTNVYLKASNNWDSFAHNETVSTGTDYHLVLTKDSSNNLALFINFEEASGSGTSANTLILDDIAVYSATFFDGKMWDVRIYDKELTEAEIKRLYMMH